MVTVQSRNGPIRNSVLPNHMTDLANFIGLESRYSVHVLANDCVFVVLCRDTGSREGSCTLFLSHRTSAMNFLKEISIILITEQNHTHKLVTMYTKHACIQNMYTKHASVNQS